MSVTPPSSSRRMSVAERLAAPNSSYTQTFNGSQLYHSRHGSSPLGKHSLDCFPALPRHGGEHTPPRFAKRQKIVKTSLDGSRNCEVRDHMNKQMLDLARMTREVYAAKMQYQRLRMQELEMIKLVMGDELEETQGCLNQMERQRISGTSFIFSASMPPLLVTSASETISYLRSTPLVLTTLHDNVDATRSVLEKTEGITLLGHRVSPIIHFCLRNSPQYLMVTPSAPDHGVEECVLQNIVDDALANRVFIKHLRDQELIDSRLTICIAAMAALSKKDMEKAVGIVKASIGRVLAKRR
ncbi:hypothetical protein HD554DRAFT_2260079 [Boletus coccyginus]|nr:hypothetical protein HD554DRAFT_2260079 [Boletus coccyginus]